MDDSETTENQKTVNHALEAAREVMVREIAWFQTLDAETLKRVADTAPPRSHEHKYATDELRRRGASYSTRAPAA